MVETTDFLVLFFQPSHCAIPTFPWIFAFTFSSTLATWLFRMDPDKTLQSGTMPPLVHLFIKRHVLGLFTDHHAQLFATKSLQRLLQNSFWTSSS
jgi:hypothetical protein